MKTTIKNLVFTSIALAIITISCSKGDDDNNPPPVAEPTVVIPVLSSISPTNGPKTTIVTINGANFDTNLNTTKVFFNEAEALVQAVTETQITAIVPPRAFTGLVKVINKGKELTGPTFSYVITEAHVSTIAGSNQGHADGTGANAQFDYPSGVIIDTQNNIYVADNRNHKIRKITPSGVVSTIAGGNLGDADGAGANAQFSYPSGITIDAQNNLYVADRGNDKIRKITPSGVVSTIAGSNQGYVDGTGANAQFNSPSGITIDAQNNLYVAEYNNHKIRKITPSGVVSTIAGGDEGYADGTGANAKFSFPRRITIDAQNNLYVADTANDKIRKITPNGVVSTIAGGDLGYTDGTGANAQFNFPSGITIDAQNNLYIADTVNNKIRRITPSGVVSTIAGGDEGFADGTGANAQFNDPYGITIDTQNNLYVADATNNKIRKITQE